MSIFHERLCGLRDKSGMTQAQIAESLNLKPQLVSYYFNGREPSYEILVKFADHFDVSTDYLLGRTDIPKNQMPEISDNITEVWKVCLEKEQLSIVFNHMLDIMKLLRHSYDLIELTENGNEFVSRSTSFFGELQSLFDLCMYEAYKEGVTFRDFIRKADAIISSMNSMLDELKWLPFEINEPIETEDGE